MLPVNLIEPLVSRLSQRGWARIDSFLSADLLLGLHTDGLEHHQRHAFKEAQVGYGTDRERRLDVRTDSIAWIAPDTQVLIQQEYLNLMTQMMSHLSQQMFIPMNEFETHYAAYEAGGSYQRHLDRFAADDSRILSSVIFLNPEWQAHDGGALRLFCEREPDRIDEDILPLMGTGILFLSDCIFHEVLKTARFRLALTGWMRCTPFQYS